MTTYILEYTFDPTNGCLYHPSENTSWFRKGRGEEKTWVIQEWAVDLLPAFSKAICDFIGKYEGTDEVTFTITKEHEVEIKN